METRYIEFVQDVLITVRENIRELENRKTFAYPKELTHIEVRMLAYQEFLEILRMSAEAFKLPKEKIGID